MYSSPTVIKKNDSFYFFSYIRLLTVSYIGQLFSKTKVPISMHYKTHFNKSLICYFFQQADDKKSNLIKY